MLALPRAASIMMVLLAATAAARAGERDKLNACQAMVDRTAQAQHAGAEPRGAPEQAELEKCRQIIREWTLRDSRMLVDEHGRRLNPSNPRGKE